MAHPIPAPLIHRVAALSAAHHGVSVQAETLAGTVGPRLEDALHVLAVDTDPARGARLLGKVATALGVGEMARLGRAAGRTDVERWLQSRTTPWKPRLIVVDESSLTLVPPGPDADVIVFSDRPSLEGALAVWRAGGCDYLPGTVEGEPLAARLRRVCLHGHFARRNLQRGRRLRLAVRKLNDARRAVGRKVDLLCQDLVNAYSDLAADVEEVRLTANLRESLATAGDLEQLLCHTMDWVLRHAGHCNIALFLHNDDDEAELGAYMKYTLSGEGHLTDFLRDVILPKAGNTPGVYHARPETLATLAHGSAAEAMATQCLAAVDCNYLAEPLGTIIIFRDGGKPLDDKVLRMLDRAAPEFATALTRIVGRDDEDDADDGDTCDNPPDATSSKKRRPRKPDPADWWRRGEEPPF